jgi:hypothetical protein
VPGRGANAGVSAREALIKSTEKPRVSLHIRKTNQTVYAWSKAAYCAGCLALGAAVGLPVELESAFKIRDNTAKRHIMTMSVIIEI